MEELQTRLRDTASELKEKNAMIAQLRTTQQQLHRRNVVLESLYKTGSMPLPSSSAPASISTLSPDLLPSSGSPAPQPTPDPAEPLGTIQSQTSTQRPLTATAAAPDANSPWPATVSMTQSGATVPDAHAFVAL